MRTRSTVEVPPLQIQCSEEIVDTLRCFRSLRSAQSLTSPHPTHPWVLEGGEYPVEYPRGPGDIVIGEDGDLRLDFRYGSSHLAPFVGLGYAENAYAGRLHAFDHFPCTLDVCIDGY